MTLEQQEQLISYMEDHPKFAKRQTTRLSVDGKRKFKKMLAEVSTMCNELGPTKEPVQWGEVCFIT